MLGSIQGAGSMPVVEGPTPASQSAVSLLPAGGAPTSTSVITSKPSEGARRPPLGGGVLVVQRQRTPHQRTRRFRPRKPSRLLLRLRLRPAPPLSMRMGGDITPFHASPLALAWKGPRISVTVHVVVGPRFLAPSSRPSLPITRISRSPSAPPPRLSRRRLARRPRRHALCRPQTTHVATRANDTRANDVRPATHTPTRPRILRSVCPWRSSQNHSRLSARHEQKDTPRP